MSLILIFVIFSLVATIWDLVRVNDLVGKAVDPAEYQRAHPAAPGEPAPRLVIGLPSAERPA